MLLLATSVLALSGCNNSSAPGTKIADSTILIYMCGADLESARESGSSQVAGLATADLKEILSVSGQPDDVNIVIQTGGASRWSASLGISAKETGRYHVENKKLVKDDSLLKANMGSSRTLQNFLEWGLTEYPAEKTGLILWNHGGALSGVCFDENYNGDSLTDVEVAFAVQGAMETVGRTEKLEWIGYDACLMSVQDIAEMNSPYFNYMVASEEAEVGDGWAYYEWIDDLYEHKPTEDVLKEICDGFIKSVDELSAYYAKYGYDLPNNQNLAVIDLNKIGAYKDAIESLAVDIKATVKTNKSTFRNTLKRAKFYADMIVSADDYSTYVYYYGYPSTWFSNNADGTYTLLGCYLYGTFDAFDMLNKLETSSLFANHTSKIQTAKDALGEAVLYNKKGNAAGESNGLCVVAPMADGNYDTIDYSAKYTNFVNWRSLFY